VPRETVVLVGAGRRPGGRPQGLYGSGAASGPDHTLYTPKLFREHTCTCCTCACTTTRNFIKRNTTLSVARRWRNKEHHGVRDDLAQLQNDGGLASSTRGRRDGRVAADGCSSPHSRSHPKRRQLRAYSYVSGRDAPKARPRRDSGSGSRDIDAPRARDACAVHPRPQSQQARRSRRWATGATRCRSNP
jgi:hypothetical protein